MKTNKYFIINLPNTFPNTDIIEKLSAEKDAWCVANKHIIDEVADEKLDIIYSNNFPAQILITLTYFTKNQ